LGVLAGGAMTDPQFWLEQDAGEVWTHGPDGPLDMDEVQIVTELNRLADEVDRLREALAFYADRDNWVWEPPFDSDGSGGSEQEIDNDHGHIAREALNPAPKKEK
jgi:hypothetical protein